MVALRGQFPCRAVHARHYPATRREPIAARLHPANFLPIADAARLVRIDFDTGRPTWTVLRQARHFSTRSAAKAPGLFVGSRPSPTLAQLVVTGWPSLRGRSSPTAQVPSGCWQAVPSVM